jgi:DNA-binding Xre family transcriptional regulator
MARKTDSTYEREMKDPAFRAAFEKEWDALEVSEFMAQKMAEQGISVRGLAARSGVSPTVIQGIKSGKRVNIQYSKLKPIVSALGYQIFFKKVAAGQ